MGGAVAATPAAAAAAAPRRRRRQRERRQRQRTVADDDATTAAEAVEREDVLATCVQQPSFCAQAGRQMWLLPCVCKRLHRLVHEACSGMLAATLRGPNLARVSSLGEWLPRHGSLLCALELRGGDPCWYPYASSAWRASLPPHRQHPPVVVLARLPSTLTRLELHNWSIDSPALLRAQLGALAAAATAGRLPRLRELALCYRGWKQGDAEVVLPALASLPQLARLELTAPFLAGEPSQQPVRGVRCGPAHLQQLVIHALTATSKCDWLALAHVTGRLTSLVLPGTCVDSGNLPETLRSLRAGDCTNTYPLLSLTQLTRLSLAPSRLRADQLLRLSGLQQLQRLELDMPAGVDKGYVASLAEGLAALPITRIHAPLQELTPASLAHLGACRGLTALRLPAYSLVAGATTEQLAATVSQLTALKKLKLTPAFNSSEPSRQHNGSAPSRQHNSLAGAQVLGPAVLSLPLQLFLFLILFCVACHVMLRSSS